MRRTKASADAPGALSESEPKEAVFWKLPLTYAPPAPSAPTMQQKIELGTSAAGEV